MNKTLCGMAAVALIFVVIAFVQGGAALAGRGFYVAGATLVSVFPILVVAFLVSGLVSTLIPGQMVTRWLGQEAGWMGPLWGSLMGALVPGGPFFFYPLMATLIYQGASVGTMISFVAAKTLWNVARLPMEIAFVGVEITVIRFIITFAIPILAGGAVNLFFPGFAEKIKDDVQLLQAKLQAKQQAGKRAGKKEGAQG